MLKVTNLHATNSRCIVIVVLRQRSRLQELGAERNIEGRHQCNFAVL